MAPSSARKPCPARMRRCPCKVQPRQSTTAGQDAGVSPPCATAAASVRLEGVDLGDVAAGKFENRRAAYGAIQSRRQHFRASLDGLRDRRVQILHLVTGQLVAERIRQLTVADEHELLAEFRFDADAADALALLADLGAVGRLVVGNELAV